ncbi:MAG: XRE family transcriptional regulator [Bryobacter sp.]|nr:XRE family transcriptional regulator [Bryobacter sp.]
MNEYVAGQSTIDNVTEENFSTVQSQGTNANGNKNDFKSSESSDATIRRILSSYDIGNKLRQLRLQKKIALVDLGKHTGLSASMISQLENGKLVPTLPTLARIAMVFDVGLDYFFSDKRRRRLFSVVRSNERMRFPERSDSPSPGYYFECLAFSAQDKSLQAYLAEFPPLDKDSASEHVHEGAEFFHVLEGRVAIMYQDEEHIMETGDSVYFDSSCPHSYRGVADQTSKAIVITTPPRA